MPNRNDDILLRPARVTDLPQMVALDQLIFGAYGADEDPQILHARLEVFPAGCVILEAVESAQLLGYLTTEKWATMREPTLNEDPRTTHHPTGTLLNITTLVVNTTQQNRGLGAQLLAYAVALAEQEQCKSIVLETARAERFYLRHGFRNIGERTQRGIRLLIMQRDLA